MVYKNRQADKAWNLVCLYENAVCLLKNVVDWNNNFKMSMLMLCFDKIDGREINNETAVFGCEYTGIALQMSCFSRKMLYD